MLFREEGNYTVEKLRKLASTLTTLIPVLVAISIFSESLNKLNRTSQIKLECLVFEMFRNKQ
jgi:hypothetical protein